MIRDLAEIDKEVSENKLLEAIKINDRATIAKLLRKIAHKQITFDVIIKLADYLDPETQKPLYKSGPKTKPHTTNKIFRNAVIDTYNYLRNDLEYTRYLINRDNEAFFIAENSELWDAEGNFSPQWKYPYAKRKREQQRYPEAGEIREIVCEMYKISTRLFDDMFSERNKNK